MPQKKNPDAWELIRGKTGRIYGSLFSLLATCKGLPSSYQRDLQEDKEPLFDAHDQSLATTQIAAATLAATKFNEAKLRAAAQDPALVATEVADYLVAFGVPFREAHEVVGKVLRAAEHEGKSIREMPIGAAQGIFARIRARSGNGADPGIGACAASGRGRHRAGSGSRGARRIQSATREARGGPMRARRAKISDADAIFGLIARYAEQGLLLPRAEQEIRRNISHFLVQDEKKRVVSCVALENYGADLAEIRSLAVQPEMRGRGAGAKLLAFALDESRRRGIARVFAVTHAPDFFLRQGFEPASRQALTEKIERDCRTCAKRRSCELTAVVATVIPERIVLPDLRRRFADTCFRRMNAPVKASDIPRGFSFSSLACGLKEIRTRSRITRERDACGCGGDVHVQSRAGCAGSRVASAPAKIARPNARDRGEFRKCKLLHRFGRARRLGSHNRESGGGIGAASSFADPGVLDGGDRRATARRENSKCCPRPGACRQFQGGSVCEICAGHHDHRYAPQMGRRELPDRREVGANSRLLQRRRNDSAEYGDDARVPCHRCGDFARAARARTAERRCGHVQLDYGGRRHFDERYRRDSCERRERSAENFERRRRIGRRSRRRSRKFAARWRSKSWKTAKARSA